MLDFLLRKVGLRSSPQNGLNGVHLDEESSSSIAVQDPAPTNGLNSVHPDNESSSSIVVQAPAPTNGLNSVHVNEESSSSIEIQDGAPTNGLNGVHREEVPPPPKLDLLPAESAPQPILFSVSEQAKKSLPLIPAHILGNILKVVTNYTNERWKTVDLAFANEIATLKQEAKYQGTPSLADDPQKSRTIDFIQAAFPAVGYTGPRDQLAIDVVNAYNLKNRAKFTSLFRICDIIAGLNALDKFASQIKKAAEPPTDLENLATYQDLYYKQAIALHGRLLAHSDPRIKKQSGTLCEEIKKAYPTESLVDLPEPRMTRSRKSLCQPS